MTTTTYLPGGPVSQAGLVSEIRTRLELIESETGRLRLRYRSLPEDHAERGELLRELDRSAAIAGELEDLLGLGERNRG